jgi:plastocyanin
MLPAMARALLALALLLTACAAEEPVTPSEAQSPSPQASPEVTEPPSPEQDTEPCSDETITGKTEATIRQLDNTFSPSCLVVLGGQDIELVNRGANLHNFSIEGTQVNIDTPPGDATRTEAIGGAVEPGSHTFFCKYHRSLGMEGELTITEAG